MHSLLREYAFFLLLAIATAMRRASGKMETKAGGAANGR